MKNKQKGRKKFNERTQNGREVRKEGRLTEIFVKKYIFSFINN